MKRIIRYCSLSILFTCYITYYCAAQTTFSTNVDSAAQPKDHRPLRMIPQIIVFDSKTQDFVPGFGMPQYVREGALVLFKYKANPFLYKATVSIQTINNTFSDTAYIAAVKKQGAKLRDTTTTPTIDTTHHGNFSAVRVSTFGSIYTTEVRPTLDHIEDATAAIQQLVNIDTIIQTQRMNKANSDNVTMTTNILAALGGTGITAPADIPKYFDSTWKKLREYKNDLFREIESLRPLIGSDTTHKKVVQRLTDLANYLDTTYAGAKLIAMQKNISIITQKFEETVQANFELTDTITVADGDFAQINTSLYNYTTKQNEYVIHDKVKTYGGWRIDFSTGLGMTFGSINGDDFNLRKNANDSTTGPDTSAVTLYTTHKNHILQFNPVGFVHFYRTPRHAVPWMLSIGFSPDFTQLGNSVVYFGTGFGFLSSSDHNSRLILSAGLSAGYTNVLKPKYTGWANYARFSGLTDDDLTIRAIRFGGFFAISYNLGGFRLY